MLVCAPQAPSLFSTLLIRNSGVPECFFPGLPFNVTRWPGCRLTSLPARLVREEIKKHDLDLDDEDDLSALARKFNVSTSAMSYRLVNLGLLR